MKSTMESADVRHLLSRAGFGFSPQNALLVSVKDKKKVLKHIMKNIVIMRMIRITIIWCVMALLVQ